MLEEVNKDKKENKQALADWLWETQKVKISTDALYDIQSKRLHEYKRQQLNLLYLIHQYYEIKGRTSAGCADGKHFRSESSTGLYHCQGHYPCITDRIQRSSLQIRRCPDGCKVVFVENYNVTAAEKMIPACDLSRADQSGIQRGHPVPAI